MTYDKNIKRENGTKIRISVLFYMNNEKPVYSVNVWVCAYRKRTEHVIMGDDWEWRRSDNKAAYVLGHQLEVVTKEEYNAALTEAHNQLKPTLLPI